MPTIFGQATDKAGRTFLVVMLIGFAVALLALKMTGPDELEVESKQYCNNVAAGVWPDYDAGRYKADCGGKDPPKFVPNLTKN